MDRKEIGKKTGYYGKLLTERLTDLEETGFIKSLVSQGRERGIYYKLIDEYCLFYLYWIAPNFKRLKLNDFSEKHWANVSQTPA